MAEPCGPQHQQQQNHVTEDGDSSLEPAASATALSPGTLLQRDAESVAMETGGPPAAAAESPATASEGSEERSGQRKDSDSLTGDLRSTTDIRSGYSGYIHDIAKKRDDSTGPDATATDKANTEEPLLKAKISPDDVITNGIHPEDTTDNDDEDDDDYDDDGGRITTKGEVKNAFSNTSIHDSGVLETEDEFSKSKDYPDTRRNGNCLSTDDDVSKESDSSANESARNSDKDLDSKDSTVREDHHENDKSTNAYQVNGHSDEILDTSSRDEANDDKDICADLAANELSDNNSQLDTDVESQDNSVSHRSGSQLSSNALVRIEDVDYQESVASPSAAEAETDDSQMTYVESKKEDSDVASAKSGPGESPGLAGTNSHFESSENESGSSPRPDGWDSSLPNSREGSVIRETTSPSKAEALTIKRKASRPRGRESILQRLTDSLLAKKERDFKAKFSDSESNGGISPMHFSDSNDSFTVETSVPAKNIAMNASVYDKISESDSSNHPSPAPTPPPRDLNESGPRKPNIRWNANRVKHLRNVISNILDRESHSLEQETKAQNAALPVLNGVSHCDDDSYINGDSQVKSPFKLNRKRKKTIPVKHPKPLNAPNGVIKCKFCPFAKEMGIGAKSAVQRHERCHYTHGPFTCKLCTFSTNNWNSIKMHKTLHVQHGDCMPDEDCIIRNFNRTGKKRRGRQMGRKKSEVAANTTEVDYSLFQIKLNEEAAASTPRMYSTQSVYPGQNESQLLEGYPTATNVTDEPLKQMPSLARISSSPRSPGRSNSPAPCLTMNHNHYSPLSRMSQSSSPSRTPIHMTTLHPVDLTSQALDLSSPALDLSARRDTNSDCQDSSLDLSTPRGGSQRSNSFSMDQPDLPVDLSVSTSNVPEVFHFEDSLIGYPNGQVNEGWSEEVHQANDYSTHIRSTSDLRTSDQSIVGNSSHNDSNSYDPVNSEISPKSPAVKDRADDEKYQAKCPFCPFEAAGHKAARAVVMKHQSCHYADKRYKCETCKFSSDTVEIMRNHILLHPMEERNVLRNGVSIGGVIHPLRKRQKSRAELGVQGEEGDRVKSPLSEVSSLDIDTTHEEDSVLSSQTSHVASKRRKRRVSLPSNPDAKGLDMTCNSTPEKLPTPEVSTSSPGPPVPGTRAAAIISEAEIRKVSPPPKKRFMEKVVAEREAAKLNEMKAIEIANSSKPNNIAAGDNALVGDDVTPAQKPKVEEEKKEIKAIERKPRARRSRQLFADEQAAMDDKTASYSDSHFKADHPTSSEFKRPLSSDNFVDYDSEDFLKGFQKLNILHCPYCPFRTTGRSHGAKHNLAKHERCHGMKARFICEICTFGSKYMDSFKKHKALHEQYPNFKPRKSPPEAPSLVPGPLVIPKRKNIVSKKVGVKSVGKTVKVAIVNTSAQPELENRKRRKGINFSKTPLKKFNLKCRYCPFQTGANYAAKYNLLRHEKAHFQNNAYKCDHCTFSTAEYRKFKMHLLLHVTEESKPSDGTEEVGKQEDTDGSMALLSTGRCVASRRASKDSNDASKCYSNVKEAVPASPMKAENVKLKGKQPFGRNKRIANLKALKDNAIKSEPQPVASDTITEQTLPVQGPPKKTKKVGATLSMLQKAQRARNIKKSLILSCKFCPFKTCGTSAAARYNLKLHEDCHFRVSTYRCEICSFTTKKFIVIKKHRLLHTESVNEDNPLNKLKCDSCAFEGDDLRSLENHKAKCHPSQNLDQEARVADTPPAMPSPEMKPEASADTATQQQSLLTIPNLQGPSGQVNDKQSKKMLEIPAELWWDAQSQLYHCQWCDFTSKREHFFKVHLYCHQRKNVKFRCKGCGYGATRQAFLDHHYKEHHNEDVKNKVWASKEERAAILKPKDLYTAVTERLKLKGLDETLINSFSPSKGKGKTQSPATPFLVPAVPPPKLCNSQPSLKRPNKSMGNSTKAKRRRYHPIPPHVANPTGPERRYLCSLCPFSTTSLEVQNNHQKKHLLPDQFSCPYCTYNTRTRVYLEKHIKLHFTASLQDEAVTMLPLDFTQNLVRTEPGPVENWELDTSNLGKAKRQTKNLPKKQCRFCDRMVSIDELKIHEDRHLVGCAYLKFIDCGSPTHESEPS